MASNQFTQQFQTQAGGLSAYDATLTLDATGLNTALSFQDVPHTQDNYLQFTDFSQVRSHGSHASRCRESRPCNMPPHASHPYRGHPKGWHGTTRSHSYPTWWVAQLLKLSCCLEAVTCGSCCAGQRQGGLWQSPGPARAWGRQPQAPAHGCHRRCLSAHRRRRPAVRSPPLWMAQPLGSHRCAGS